VSNVNGKSETICLLETNLPASAWWFILASGEILRTAGNVDLYYFQDTELRNGKPGFSKRRCDLWKKNFRNSKPWSSRVRIRGSCRGGPLFLWGRRRERRNDYRFITVRFGEDTNGGNSRHKSTSARKRAAYLG
jgi:hypothetical protein